MAKTVVAFDLYGTLLSTGSIAKELTRLYGAENAKTVATQARRYQLEYTWRANSMGVYRSFSELTRFSFRQATAELGLEFSADAESRIMDSYNGLETFPDADLGLQLVAQTSSLDYYIFSNGTESMVSSSVKSSPLLSQVVSSTKIVSVDPLKTFKPAPKTYQHMVHVAGLTDTPQRVWLVSSNPFDVAGALAAGMSSIWVNREGSEWVDGLGGALNVKPMAVVRGVDEAVREIVKHDRPGA